MTTTVFVGAISDFQVALGVMTSTTSSENLSVKSHNMIKQ